MGRWWKKSVWRIFKGEVKTFFSLKSFRYWWTNTRKWKLSIWWIYFWSNSSIRVNSKCLFRQYNNNSFSFYKDWQNQSHMSHISWIKLVCRYCKLCVWKQISVSDVIYNFWSCTYRSTTDWSRSTIVLCLAL